VRVCLWVCVCVCVCVKSNERTKRKKIKQQHNVISAAEKSCTVNTYKHTTTTTDT